MAPLRYNLLVENWSEQKASYVEDQFVLFNRIWLTTSRPEVLDLVKKYPEHDVELYMSAEPTEVLAECVSITKIVFRDVNFQHVARLAASLVALPRLRTLCFYECDFDQRLLLERFKEMRSLHRVSWLHTHLNIHHLCECLPGTTIRALEFRTSSMSDMSKQMLASTMASLGVTDLTLHDNDFCPTAYLDVMSKIHHVSYTTDQDDMSTLQVLADNPRLQKLQAFRRSRGIPEEKLRYLAKIVQRVRVLRYYPAVRYSTAQMEAFAESLHESRTIQVIALNLDAFTMDHARILINGIGVHRTLKKIVITARGNGQTCTWFRKQIRHLLSDTMRVLTLLLGCMTIPRIGHGSCVTELYPDFIRLLKPMMML
jgi:hypothetical protein